MRNVAQVGRREIEAQRDIVVGVTASVPAYKVADDAGNKEWVVDVYLGPLEEVEKAIVRNVPIAPNAKELVADIRQPVQLFRSRQGKYTVTGRAKILAAGAQMPGGSIAEPTYRRTVYNLAALRAEFIADLDYTLQTLGGRAALQVDPEDALQEIRAFDAFGNQVAGLGVDPEDEGRFGHAETTETRTRHTVLRMATLGPPGASGAMQFGVSELQPAVQVVVEAIS